METFIRSVGEDILYKDKKYRVWSREKEGGKNVYILITIHQSNSFIKVFEENMI